MNTKFFFTTKLLLIVVITCNIQLISLLSFAQNVGISTTGITPDASAALDINFNDKGLLIPRVALTGTTDNTTILSPAMSLMVYNTASAGTPPNNVVPGFYYWNGIRWIRISTGSAHYIGEEYLGGIIFFLYLDSNLEEHGLVVSITETTAKWQNPASLIGANRVEDGAYNTSLMTNSPAKDWITANFSSEWYLPSVDELSLLFQNLFFVDATIRENSYTPITATVATDYYWSSNEINSTQARTFSFYSNYWNSGGKTNDRLLRAIRSF